MYCLTFFSVLFCGLVKRGKHEFCESNNSFFKFLSHLLLGTYHVSLAQIEKKVATIFFDKVKNLNNIHMHGKLKVISVLDGVEK